MAAPPAARRDSRIHLQLRHSDALQEQEAFRRKYLLVNKHITKLNAGLNLRVEELNTQITQLNSENIALRSKVIELTRKLAGEQASTRRTAAEAESLTSNAIRQLASLRDAFATLASPIATPPAHLPSLAPREPVARSVLAKKPDISFIRETSQEVEDIPKPRGHLYSKEEDDMPSPPAPAAFITSRRTSRRPTIPIEPQLPPARPTASKASELAAMSSEEEVESELETPPLAAKSSISGKSRGRIEAALARQKSPEVDDSMPAPVTTRRRLANKENDMDALREESGEETNRTSTVRRAIKRRPVTPPPSSAVDMSDTPVPASRVMSLQPQNTDDQTADGLRERRTRKSVNYAEPKLNTKMRKPEGFEAKIKPRVSNASKETTPPVSTTSSKTPSTSSMRAKPSTTTTSMAALTPTSDADEETDVLRSKVRRHSMAV
ncbi:hypothetical protein CALVIDRAFT_603448 [Calocera viscosa TUFC12733]|uniref:Shugoshin C-terminal domain-containing protein n=1 Tax=Calocera viscosa (strain TUFC12733) TaxID=1330018 RepID=A0A167FQW2_CALVF|nr:hypothetical protein CALVIDRAFT_603448 [Calocera viscosa TUFC12733]